MSTVCITGGTGLIGKALTAVLLQRGYEVVVLTRGKPAQNTLEVSRLSYASWNIAAQTIDGVKQSPISKKTPNIFFKFICFINISFF